MAGPDCAGPNDAELIQPDRVHGSLYTDPRVFVGCAWQAASSGWPESRSCWSTATSRCLPWPS